MHRNKTLFINEKVVKTRGRQRPSEKTAMFRVVEMSSHPGLQMQLTTLAIPRVQREAPTRRPRALRNTSKSLEDHAIARDSRALRFEELILQFSIVMLKEVPHNIEILLEGIKTKLAGVSLAADNKT